MSIEATESHTVRVLYTAEATASGGRSHGHAKTSDGRLAVDFSSPVELAGDGGPGTNPEQLFALAFSGCYQNALLGIAMRRHLEAGDSEVTARVGLGTIGSGRFGLEVTLLIRLPSITDVAEAQSLVAEAERRCPMSNAVRGNVNLTLELVEPQISP